MSCNRPECSWTPNTSVIGLEWMYSHSCGHLAVRGFDSPGDLQTGSKSCRNKHTHTNQFGLEALSLTVTCSFTPGNTTKAKHFMHQLHNYLHT